MDFGRRASIKLTVIPFNDELNSAINCSEVAAICSCKFTSLALTVGYCQFERFKMVSSLIVSSFDAAENSQCKMAWQNLALLYMIRHFHWLYSY